MSSIWINYNTTNFSQEGKDTTFETVNNFNNVAYNVFDLLAKIGEFYSFLKLIFRAVTGFANNTLMKVELINKMKSKISSSKFNNFKRISTMAKSNAKIQPFTVIEEEKRPCIALILISFLEYSRHLTIIQIITLISFLNIFNVGKNNNRKFRSSIGRASNRNYQSFELEEIKRDSNNENKNEDNKNRKLIIKDIKYSFCDALFMMFKCLKIEYLLSSKSNLNHDIKPDAIKRDALILVPFYHNISILIFGLILAKKID